MYDFFSPVPAIRKITKQKAEKNIKEAYSYLNNDFKAVAAFYERYYPLELLKLSLWDERKVLSEKKRDSLKRASAVLLPVMLESVLSSTFVSGFSSSRTVNEKDWERIKALSDDVLRRIIRIIENKCAIFLSSTDAGDEDAVGYREILAKYLIPEEVNKESLVSSSIMLRSLLEEKAGMKEKIGFDTDTFWINVDNIAKNGLNAIDDLCRRVQTYSDEYRAAFNEMKDSLQNKSNEEIFDIITKKKGWQGRAESLAIERDGFSLFALSSLSSLPSSAFRQFTTRPGALDLMSFLSLGYWPSARFPFIEMDGDVYSFVGKHIPSFISLSSSFDRKEATFKSVLSIFFLIGVDTYTYDGNSIDISVLPSFFDRNLFTDPDAYMVVKKKREEERAIKAQYGHKRLIVDPDQREDMVKKDDVLLISSSFMSEAAVDRNKKHELIESLLGELEFPETTKEYKVVDEDEIERESVDYDDDIEDKITDEYEYDSSDEDSSPIDEKEDECVVEYEKKPVDMAKEEERYSLPEAIVEKEEEEEHEEEEYSRELDDDIFDDTDEEERLDEIGEKEEDDYYLDVDQEETAPDEEREDEAAHDDEEPDDGGQLDFFNLLDDEVEEEKIVDDELEKEDEEEFVAEEKKEESLDSVPDEFPLPGIDEEEKAEDDSEVDDSSDEDKEDGEEKLFDETPSGEPCDEEDIPSSEEENDVAEDFSLPGIDEDEKAEGEATPLDVESDGNEKESSSVEETKAEDDEGELDIEASSPEEEPSETMEPFDETPSIGPGDNEIEENNSEVDEGFSLPGIDEEEKVEDEESTFDENSSIESDGNEKEDSPVEEPKIESEDSQSELDNETSLDEEEKAEGESEVVEISDEDKEDEGVPLDSEDEEEIPSSEEEENKSEVDEEFTLPSIDEEGKTEVDSELVEISDEDEETPLDETSSVESGDYEKEESIDKETETEADEGEQDDEASSLEETSETIEPFDETPSIEPGDNEIEENNEVDEAFSHPGMDEEESGSNLDVVDEKSESDDADEEVEPLDENKKDEEVPSVETADYLGGSLVEDAEADSELDNEAPSTEINEPFDTTPSTENEDFSLPSIEDEENEKSDDVDSSVKTTEKEERENGSDVNAWMKSFMGLDDDDSPDGDEDETFESAQESGDDTLPEAEEKTPLKEENAHTVISMDELEDEKVELPLMENSFDDEGGIVPGGILYDIYKRLGSASVFASFLRDAGMETQEDLEKAIKGCWTRMIDDDKDKLFNIPSYSLSIILSRDHIRDDLRMSELINNAGGVMYSRGEESWTAVILYINPSYEMEEAFEKRITPDGFSPSDWKRVCFIGEQMKKR